MIGSVIRRFRARVSDLPDKVDAAGSVLPNPKPPTASTPAYPLSPRDAGNGRPEVSSGPCGALAIYHFASDHLEEARRLLVLKLDHRGDFLIGLPALQRLRGV